MIDLEKIKKERMQEIQEIKKVFQDICDDEVIQILEELVIKEFNYLSERYKNFVSQLH